MDGLRLERVTGDDAALIAETAAIAFAAEVARAHGTPFDEALVAARRRCRAELDMTPNCDLSGAYHVHDDLGIRCGEIWLVPRDEPVAHCLHLLWLQIFLEHRRRGLAKAVMRHVITKSASLGIQALTLNVFDANHEAAALYRQCGFERYERGLIRWLTPKPL